MNSVPIRLCADCRRNYPSGAGIINSNPGFFQDGHGCFVNPLDVVWAK
jgi:hypothetical protein